MKKFSLIVLTCILVLVGCASNTLTWQEQYDIGVRYLSEGNYTEAIIAFTAAIEIDSNNMEFYIKRGQAYHELAAKSQSTLAIEEIVVYYNNAKADFEQVLKYGNYNAEVIGELAAIYHSCGDLYFDSAEFEDSSLYYRKAISEYEKSLDYYTLTVEVYKKLSQCYVAIGEYSKANDVLARGYVETGDESLDYTISIPIIHSGICGDELMWELDAENTLTISGRGDMYDYEFSETAVGGETSSTAPWFDYSYDIERIVVENGVTGLGKNAFVRCANATEISISDSVKSVRFQALYECGSIENITLPPSLEELGDRVFNGCRSLTDFYIADGNMHFSTSEGILYSKDMSELICYPAGREGKYVMSSGITNVARSAFTCCAMSELVISESVKSFGFNPIWACNNLTVITVPDNVTSISNMFLGYCNSLIDVRIGDGVDTLPQYTFYHCEALESIHLGRGITRIERNAVIECGNLTDLYYAGSESEWNKINIDNNYNEWLNDVVIHYNA